MLLGGHSPTLIVFVKCIALWLASGLPLVLASPMLGLFLALSPTAIGATMATLFVGTPAITFSGAVASP